MANRNDTDLAALLAADRTLVMGILNVTPDSFSDGGKFDSVDRALKHAGAMIDAGADIIDVGGESTRPGAAAVSAGEEYMRVVPVIDAIRERFDVAISVDTSKPEIMRDAVDAGATLVNDVRALQEFAALETVAGMGVPVCLMHMQGQPRTMQAAPEYGNVVEDVIAFLKQRIDACITAGIDENNILIDPGFGFGKTLEHNLCLLKNLHAFDELGKPLLIGLSRKSMLGAILGDVPPGQRVSASVAGAVMAAQKGAKIVRVHDVRETVDALRLVDATEAVDCAVQ